MKSTPLKMRSGPATCPAPAVAASQGETAANVAATTTAKATCKVITLRSVAGSSPGAACTTVRLIA
jgi:hypothetical protein